MTETNIAPFNLSQSRRRHSALMREAIKSDNSRSLIGTVEAFVQQVEGLGAVLNVEDDRVSAQNILDYWSAWLSGIDSSRARQLIKLQPFEAEPHLQTAAIASPSSRGRNPFRDMDAFRRTDSTRVPGREDAIRSILKLLDQYGIVFVIERGGGGGSALVNGGVLWQLENASDARAIFSVATLGDDPLAALAAAVPGTNAAEIVQDPAKFRSSFEAACGSRPGVLSIDNAEELFTRCTKPAAREAFATAVAALSTDRPNRHDRTIIVLREEWEDQVLALKGFSSVPREACFRPAPPTAAELQRMIEIPAAAAGVTFENGIVEDLVRELQGDVSALPLIRFMLMRLWSSSDGRRFDAAAYHRVGRPQEALVRAAADTYTTLSQPGKEAAQRLFLTLAAPRLADSEQGWIARSHREMRHILTNGERDSAMVEAVDAFIDAGLLRTSAPPDDGLELVHDGLLHRWSTAVEWLVDEKRRTGGLLEILAAAKLWQKFDRPDGLLLADWSAVNKAHEALRSRQDDFPCSDSERQLLLDYTSASASYLDWRDWRARNIKIFKNVSLFVLLPSLAVLGILAALFYSDFWATNWLTSYNRLNRLAWRDDAIITIKDPARRDDRKRMFLRLEQLQRLTTFDDVDLSPAGVDHLDLENLTLHAPNFSGAPFADAILKQTFLPNAALQDSTFAGKTAFDEAKLPFAQFQDANFMGPANFHEAYLYRAAFDRARLCEADFSGAGLVNATFWNAALPVTEGKFQAAFKNSPWWLASGWTFGQLQWLQNATSDAKAIAATRPFRDRINQVAAVLNSVSPSDLFGRAVAHNNLAWELATWGVCIQQPCALIPDAEEQANNAVNLIEMRMKQSTDAASPKNKDIASRLKSKYSSMLATRGYIRLQKGNVDEALLDLEQAMNTGAIPGGDVLFHYSIALKAKGRVEAKDFLERSFKMDYRPHHELKNLWRYLDDGSGGDFAKEYNRLFIRRITKMTAQQDPIRPCD